MKKILLIFIALNIAGCSNRNVNLENNSTAQNASNNKYIYLNEYDEFTEDIVQGLMTRERMDTNGILLNNYTIKPHKKKYKLKVEITINDSMILIDLFDIEANDKEETLLYCSDRYILKAALSDEESLLVYNEYNMNELIGYPIFSTVMIPYKDELYKLANNEVLVSDWKYVITSRESFESHDYEPDDLFVKLKLEVIK